MVVIFDTNRFRGRKTKAFYLTVDNGTKMEFRFTVTADSCDPPPWQLWEKIKQMRFDVGDILREVADPSP